MLNFFSAKFIKPFKKSFQFNIFLPAFCSPFTSLSSLTRSSMKALPALMPWEDAMIYAPTADVAAGATVFDPAPVSTSVMSWTGLVRIASFSDPRRRVSIRIHSATTASSPPATHGSQC